MGVPSQSGVEFGGISMNLQSMRRGAAAAALMLAALGGLQAHAATITFEGVVPPGGYQVPVTPYTEAGFTLTNSGAYGTDGIFTPGSGINDNGSAVFGWCTSCGPVTITLTYTGGGTFSLSSLDAANLNGGFTNQSIVATGHVSGGGTVVAILPLTDNWSVFLLPGFASLTSVDFFGSNNFSDNVGFDNLVSANAVPIPGALPLFATGLAGLGWLARRRRKQAA
jgi:hypothetical protein